MTDRAARFVEEVNDAARQAAQKDDQKAHRADQSGDPRLNAAESTEHHLQNVLARAFAREADWYGGDRSLDRHHREKIYQPNVRTQSVSDEEESRKRREMRDQRNQECENAASPMPGVEMVGSGYLDEFLARRKFFR